MSEIEQIRLSTLTKDVDVRLATAREDLVRRYADLIREEEVKFPPVTVFRDGETLRLADGYLRVEAARVLGREWIEAEVREGDKRAALLYAIEENVRQGHTLTQADRRRAVELMLKDEVWCTWSSREIARRCGVDHKTVEKVRRELYPKQAPAGRGQQGASGEFPQTDDPPKRKARRNGKIIEQKTRKVGSSVLTPEQLKTVRENPHLSGTKLAAKLHVHKSTISRVRNGKTYSDDGYDPRLVELRGAWQKADGATREAFLRWLLATHRAAVEAVMTEGPVEQASAA